MKFKIASGILVLSSCFATAQRPPSDPKHEIHYLVQPVETGEVSITFKDAHSQMEFTQVGMNITNNSSDYLYVAGSEMKFKYAHGEYSPKKSMLTKVDFLVDPKTTESKTFKITGDNRFHVESLHVVLNGFYKISINGQVIPVPDFQLPAAKNDFNAGSCTCTLEKSKQTTAETAAQFKCKYNGNNVMIVDPSKLSVKLKDGQEFANNNKKDKGGLLMPGDEIKFTASFVIPGKIADMQFTVMNINWNNTFMESGKIPIKLGTAQFTYDEGMTLLKNK